MFGFRETTAGGDCAGNDCTLEGWISDACIGDDRISEGWISDDRTRAGWISDDRISDDCTGDDRIGDDRISDDRISDDRTGDNRTREGWISGWLPRLIPRTTDTLRVTSSHTQTRCVRWPHRSEAFVLLAMRENMRSPPVLHPVCDHA
jgi:hypothetical protein